MIGSAALLLMVLLHSVAARAQEASSSSSSSSTTSSSSSSSTSSSSSLSSSSTSSSSSLSSSSSSYSRPSSWFVDVPAGAYYDEAATALLRAGALEGAAYLRPADYATRAEMMKMLVLLNDENLVYPQKPNFNDVPTSAWYYTYIETAAAAGWVKGDDDCYQRLIPCKGRPEANINRAEAATLLMRAFGYEPLALAPRFSDVSTSAWYDRAIQAAADHCILQGDEGTGRVRPGALMNRAEMITMFRRAQQDLEYGVDCGVSRPAVTSVSVDDETHLRVVFNVDLAVARAENVQRYRLVRASDGTEIEVEEAEVLTDRSVRLTISSALRADTRYTLSYDQLSTTAGAFFTGSFGFDTEDDVVSAHISGVTVVSPTQIEISFNEDVDETNVENTSRFSVRRIGNSSGALVVQSSVRLSGRRVQLTLANALVSGASYQLKGTGLLTTAGTSFDGNFNFGGVTSQPASLIQSITALSSTRLRVAFKSDLDAARLGEAGRFVLASSGGTVVVATVGNILDRSADLYLESPLAAQAVYRLSANGMLTADGATLSDSSTFVYDLDDATLKATLNGSQQVPASASMGTGSGTFTLQKEGLRYDISVLNLASSITDAHFHLGAPGVSGAVVFPITFNGNTATGIWTNLTDDQRTAILRGNVYVNIHTTTYPDGEIRGQVVAQ